MNNIITVIIIIMITSSFVATLFMMCAFRLSSRLSRIEEQDWDCKEYKN